MTLSTAFEAGDVFELSRLERRAWLMVVLMAAMKLTWTMRLKAWWGHRQRRLIGVYLLVEKRLIAVLFISGVLLLLSQLTLKLLL